MSTIFQISRQLEDLFSSVPEDGTMTDLQIQEYENLGIAMAEKQENTIRFACKLEAQEIMIDAEIDRLRKLKASIKSKEAQIMWLLDYQMTKLGVDRLDCGIIAAVRKLNPPSVVLDESVELPSEYTRQKITIEPDKVKIKDALKEGVVIEGCSLQQTSRIDIN